MIDALGTEEPPQIDELMRYVRHELDDDIACHAIEVLGSINDLEAINRLIDVITGEFHQRRAKAAVQILIRYRLAESVKHLVDLLCSTPLQGPGIGCETHPPLELRLEIADGLTRTESIEKLKPYRAQIARALVASEEHELRAKIAQAFARLWTGDERLGVILDSLLYTPSVNRSNLDSRALTTALRPRDAEDRRKMADRLVSETLKQKERRAIDMIAGLLILISDTIEAAGQALNDAAIRLGYKETQLRALRIQIGGETALSPLLHSIEDDLENYFRKPLHELRNETERNWQQTMRSAQHGFTVRVIMSVLVFLLGLTLVAASAIVIIAGRNTDALFGPGVSLASGLGTMLLVIYTGPLKDIRSSVTDLGAANAAFIAYVHRVSEISHTFSAKYLAEDVRYEDLEISCRLLSEAAKDSIKELQGDSKESGMNINSKQSLRFARRANQDMRRGPRLRRTAVTFAAAFSASSG